MKFSAAAQAHFCTALAELCNVGKACAAAGISRQTAYHHREKNPEFAAAWDRALEMGIGAMEDEAHRRAVIGVDEPIVYKGGVTGTVKKYSDQLLIFLLRAHRPEVYRETQRVRLSGGLGVAQMSDEQLDAELADLAAKMNPMERASRVAALVQIAATRAAEADDGCDLA